jgi:hypothetical protein
MARTTPAGRERITLDLSKLFAGVFYCAYCDIFTDDEKKHYHGEVPLD